MSIRLTRTTTTALTASLAMAASLHAQLPAAGAYLSVDGSRIYYEECGTGPHVVLLHDGATPASTWDKVWPLLCPRFHVVRYDRRGMGRSDTPAKPFSQTDDLDLLLTDRKIARATIIGSSSGGAIAIDYALVHPEKVERLVLVGAVVNGMAMSDYFYDVKAASLAARAKERRYDPRLEQRIPVSAAARLGDIRVPTLVLVGETDNADVHAHAGAIELGIWGAKREVVRNAEHLVQQDQPNVFSEEVSSFIEGSPVVSVSDDRLQALAGTYRSPGGQGEVVVDRGRLVLRLPGEHELPLFPSSDSTFYALIWNHYTVRFRHDSTGTLAADISVEGRPQTTAVRTSTRLTPAPR